MRSRIFLLVAVLASTPGFAGGFSNQTVAAGVVFQHSIPSDHRSGPMSGGGAVGDFNNDGYPDLYVLGGGLNRDALFINNGDGTFSDQSEQWNVLTPHRGVGATVADYDDDGDDDIYLTSFGPMQSFESPGAHRLLRNEGGYFSNVAVDAGLNMTTENYGDGYGAAFGDYDRDGDLDLFVGAWHGVQALGARLFRNDGSNGFTNVTTEAGVITRSTHAFGAIWADMDGDRYPELIVAGDFGTSRYYRNNQDGTFTELDPGTGLAPSPADHWNVGKAHNAMGITAGDFNRDGLIDFFITAIWPTFAYANDFWGNGLYINHGGHVFSQMAESAGVHDGGWGWGTSAVDLDNNGWPDLPMTNGWPFADPVTFASFSNEQSYLFMNAGNLSFDERALTYEFDHRGEGRALLHLDYDRDGDMDIVILSNNEVLQLYRNERIAGAVPPDAHWLQVKLDTAGRSAYAPHGAGAIIEVTTRSGVQKQQVVLGGTYLGQSELVAHFGLGTDRWVRHVVVDWGNGRNTRRNRVSADQRIILTPPCRRPGHALRPPQSPPGPPCMQPPGGAESGASPPRQQQQRRQQ